MGSSRGKSPSNVMNRSAIVVALAVTVACKRHEDAAPSSTVTTAPSSFPSASASIEPVASAPSASASAEIAQLDAGPPAVDEAAKERARKAALAEAAEYGMLGLLGVSDAGLESASGPGIMPNHVGATRLPAGSRPTASVRMGSITVNGRLPKEVVQRIVRQRFGSFRLCYADGLRNNPSLAGRVTTRFVIDPGGHVSTTQDSGSDMPDQNVVQCVVRAFGNIDFPQPEGGIVIATVPLMFSASQPR